MSIPSVKFNRPRPPSNPRRVVTFSSSYSEDYSDDIPMLDSFNKKGKPQNLLLSDSFGSDYDYSGRKENDWTAKTSQVQRIPLNQRPNNQPVKPVNAKKMKIQMDEYSSQDSDNDFVIKGRRNDKDIKPAKSDWNSSNNYNSRNDKTGNSDNISNINNNSIETNKSNINNIINSGNNSNTIYSNNNNNTVDSNNNNIIYGNNNNNIIDSSNNNGNRNITSSDVIINPKMDPEKSAQNESALPNNQNLISSAIQENNPQGGQARSCLIFKQVSSKLKKNKFRMEENSKVVYFAVESRDSKGKIFVITSNDSKKDGTSLRGYVRFNSSNIFTIISSEEKFNDDREGELCSVEIEGEIIHQSSSSRYKHKKIKIVIPKNRKPYYPISRRKSLSKIVQIRNGIIAQSEGQRSASNPALNLDKFDFFESINPSLKDDKSSDVSKLFINPSPKNFAIRDDEKKTIFILYKIAYGSFQLSFSEPFSPLVAFGIGIAVISS